MILQGVLDLTLIANFDLFIMPIFLILLIKYLVFQLIAFFVHHLSSTGYMVLQGVLPNEKLLDISEARSDDVVLLFYHNMTCN